MGVGGTSWLLLVVVVVVVRYWGWKRWRSGGGYCGDTSLKVAVVKVKGLQ